MRHPFAVVWLGLGLGILFASGQSDLWLSAGLGLIAAWFLGGNRFKWALLIVAAAFGLGAGLTAAQTLEGSRLAQLPKRFEAIGYVDRYSAMNGEKMLFITEGPVSETSGRRGLMPNRRSSPLVFLVKPESFLEPGRYYRLWLTVKLPQPPRNPGMLDYPKYLASRGIHSTGEVSMVEPVLMSSRKLLVLRENVRQRIAAVMMERLGEASGMMAAAMMLGDASVLEPEVLERFRMTGTAHVLAVSGLHFGIVFTGVEMILDRLKLSYAWKKALLFSLVAMFLGLIGLRSSALRAGVMLMVSGALRKAGRPYERLNALAFCASGLLVWRPLLLFDAGYQLSMAAVYGICAIWPVLMKPGKRLLKPRTGFSKGEAAHKLWGVLTLNLSVTAATALPSVWHFNLLSPASVLVNIPVVVLTGLALPLSFLTVIMTPLTPLSILLGNLCRGLFWLLDGLVAWSGHSLPGAGMVVATPGLLKGAGFAGIFLVFLLRKTWRKLHQAGRGPFLAAALLSGVMVVLVPLGHWLRPMDRVLYFDVGQGDSALLETRRGERILIDTGDGRTLHDSAQLLLKSGFKRVDLLVLTHPHEDHTGGAETLLKTLKIKQLVISGGVSPKTYGILLETAEKAGIEISQVWEGSIISLADTTLKVLGPPANQREMEANAASVVLLYETGDWRFLFTGDLPAAQEYAIIDKIPGKNTVLKVAHHGSKTSSSEAFVTALEPGVAIISVGRNRYGHPADRVLETLSRRGFMTLRTDDRGCVEVKTDGNQLYFRTMVNSSHHGRQP